MFIVRIYNNIDKIKTIKQRIKNLKQLEFIVKYVVKF